MSAATTAAHLGPPPAINWWAWEAHRPPMGWFILDFLLFMILLSAAALRPIRRVLLERRDQIERSIAEAAQAHSTALRSQAEHRARLAGSQAEAEAQVAQSRLEGEQERDQLVAAAQAAEQRLRADGELIVHQHQRRVALRLQADCGRAIVAQASAKARASLDSAARQRLIDAAIVAYQAQRPGPARAAASVGK